MTAGTLSHDDYVRAAPETLRPLLEALRTQLLKSLPDAQPVTAYGMPGFQIGHAIVAGYAAFSKQCGLYVHPQAVAALLNELRAAGHKPTKTGVTFSPKVPLPDALVERLALASRAAYAV